MNITKCKKCGGNVSTEADARPYRGYRMRTSPIRQVLAYLAIIGVGALMVYEIMARFPHSVP
jgi:hypothetical protein